MCDLNFILGPGFTMRHLNSSVKSESFLMISADPEGLIQYLKLVEHFFVKG